MIGETAIATIITNLIHQHKVDAWARLIIGVSFSAMCTFAGVSGSGGLAHLLSGTDAWKSIAMGIMEGLIASSATAFWLWTRNPLSKNIPIAVPSQIEIAANQILEKEGITSYGKS
jgi:hypothetical protein